MAFQIHIEYMYTDRQLREIFHLNFLEKLIKISDPKLYVLKGGINLRFFCNSPRYSQDMDLDAFGGDVSTLRKNGYKILNDDAFLRSLRTYTIDSIEINDPAKAKQTDTTQRFRVRLITGSGDPLPTKIEFSRRAKIKEKALMEKIDTEIARNYHKLAFRCQHYSGEIMVLQKVRALAGRKLTQARDVFDIGILNDGGFANHQFIAEHTSKATLTKAMENLFILKYEDFSGQVLEFLEDDKKTHYESPAAWSELQETVLELFSYAG